MPTQLELLAQHRAGMDQQFLERYPNGRYSIHIWDGANRIFRELTHVTTRPTTNRRPRGVTVNQTNDRVIRIEQFQNNSFGSNSHYDNLEACIASARRRGFSEELINAFVDQLKA